MVSKIKYKRGIVPEATETKNRKVGLRLTGAVTSER